MPTRLVNNIRSLQYDIPKYIQDDYDQFEYVCRSIWYRDKSPNKTNMYFGKHQHIFYVSTYKIGQRKSNDFLGNKLRKGHTQYQGRGSLYAKIVCETNKS